MQVTDEELEAVGMALLLVAFPNADEARWQAEYETCIAEARAAILAYLATPGQVRMREVLEWYGSRATDMARYAEQQQTTAMTAIVTELTLDAGRRAARAAEGK